MCRYFLMYNLYFIPIKQYCIFILCNCFCSNACIVYIGHYCLCGLPFFLLIIIIMDSKYKRSSQRYNCQKRGEHSATHQIPRVASPYSKIPERAGQSEIKTNSLNVRKLTLLVYTKGHGTCSTIVRATVSTNTSLT